jgi:phospholipase C
MRFSPYGGDALCTIGMAFALASCNSGASSSLPHAMMLGPESASTNSSGSPIKHVILLVQENRTFNDFFATYPGADGTTTGRIAKDTACGVRQDGTIRLRKSNLVVRTDLNHSYQAYSTAFAGGKMDGFDKAIYQKSGHPECKSPYQYTDPAQIEPYWDMAKQYTLAEHMFTTQGSSSFTAHQDLIRGGTQIDSEHSLVNDPTGSPWGCDAPPGTKTSLITKDDVLEENKGPAPCTKYFPASYSYPTLRDLLDAKGVSWKYYVLPLNKNFGGLMTAFDVIAAVRYGREWKTNIATPQTRIFGDIAKHELAAVSWLIPDEPDSDHPGDPVDDGPSWVAGILNAIGKSSYWRSTALVVVWDDWGGLYDGLPPRQVGFGGLGFRVPALIVSPYAKAGHISKTVYQFGSILRYVEDNWNLGRLGTSDSHAKSIIDCFDYSQPPIKFKKIRSALTPEYFIQRPPSGLPIDDDM